MMSKKQKDDLKWALTALWMVKSSLKAAGYRESDDLSCCSPTLWNLRTAKESIEAALNAEGVHA